MSARSRSWTRWSSRTSRAATPTRISGSSSRWCTARRTPTATTDAAAGLGLTDTGRLEPGRRADLLVLERDPRSDITAPRAPRLVLADGVVVHPEAAASTDGAIPAGLSQVVADTVAETSH